MERSENYKIRTSVRNNFRRGSVGFEEEILDLYPSHWTCIKCKRGYKKSGNCWGKMIKCGCGTELIPTNRIFKLPAKNSKAWKSITIKDLQERYRGLPHKIDRVPAKQPRLYKITVEYPVR